jgi:hypothetical protein
MLYACHGTEYIVWCYVAAVIYEYSKGKIVPTLKTKARD